MTNITICLFLFLIILVSSSTAATQEESKTYIVHVQHDAKPSIYPTHTHWYHSLATSSPSSNKPTIIHTYDTVFHGFSAKLTSLEASAFQSSSPAILSLIPEQVRRVHTTRSPEFLGLKTSDTSGLPKGV
ncbi:subtilase family protein [Artemisia annua]|uniref:Subtilase family protein n=1 Tax=Artemisia annua TaxID=35608 RepID=A0A2U1NQH2_ARTAN|nr:subtilase family protein [Artemisia annua]